MKLAGIISTAVLSLLLGIAAPVYAQEQHDARRTSRDRSTSPQRRESAARENKAKKTKSKQKKRTPEQDVKNSSQQEKKHQGRRKHAATRRASQGGREGAARPDSRRQLPRQFRPGTHISCQPRRVWEPPLRIRWLLVRIRRRLAEQLALHPKCLCCRHRRRLLPVQPDLSWREHCA